MGVGSNVETKAGVDRDGAIVVVIVDNVAGELDSAAGVLSQNGNPISESTNNHVVMDAPVKIVERVAMATVSVSGVVFGWDWFAN